MIYRSQLYASFQNVEALTYQIEMYARWGQGPAAKNAVASSTELASLLDRLRAGVDLVVQRSTPECCLIHYHSASQQATMNWLVRRLSCLEILLLELETHAREKDFPALTDALHQILVQDSREMRNDLCGARAALQERMQETVLRFAPEASERRDTVQDGTVMSWGNGKMAYQFGPVAAD
jgi:hypothetical protein